MTDAPTVLVVDDEPDVRVLVRAFLELGGFEVVAEARDGADAVRQYAALNPPPIPDVVVLDNRMPLMTGLEAAALMLLHHPGQVVVLFSAFLDAAITQRARELGVAACVDKTQSARLPAILRGLLAA